MKVIDPGHVYRLTWLDLKDPILPQEDGSFADELIFVKREGEGYPGNVGHHPGTTIQEVLRALIDRTFYLHNQIPDPHNIEVIWYLRNALLELEKRAAERHGRDFSFLGQNSIELEPTCPKCLHIGCPGDCH